MTIKVTPRPLPATLNGRSVAEMDDVAIGRRVAAARKRAGIDQRKTLTDAVELPNLGPATLGKIERGERHLFPHEADAFAQALDVDRSFFYGDAEPSSPDETGASLARIEYALGIISRREERAQEDRDAILALLAKQDQILIDIGGLLAQQTQILSEMQRVASGLPTDEALRLVTEGARQLEDALAAQAERGAASASQDERRRLAGEG